MITTASQVQIAVPLASTAAAQAALDTVAPGDFDVNSPDRTLYALASAPTIPVYAVAQGRLQQACYIALAAVALDAGISHAVIATWTREGLQPEVYVRPQAGQTLWEVLGLVPLEVE